MHQALVLAARGRKKVFPNPRVGCIIVNKGAVVGRGFHEFFGGPHAEVNALAAAGQRTSGATLYVTLEPCSHWGKTPPCVDAIIRAGIRRVVAATLDPNPLVSGTGFARLAARGIEVVNGVLEREARRLNRGYFSSFNPLLISAVPEITIKAAMTLDGKIAARTGDSKWITSPQARALGHRLRSTHDAVVVGVGTVCADDPYLTSHGRGKNPVRVVIDPNLRVPAGSRVLDSAAPTVIIYSNRRRAAKAAELKGAGIVMIHVPAKRGLIAFTDILRRLGEISIRRILVEGGGETIANALDSGMVDRIAFFIAPRIVGGRDAKTPVEGVGFGAIAQAFTIKDVVLRRIGPDILVTGSVVSNR
jgi:diaminohydroxyphosphoribosylaminopyrimidine deaminase/5-amino-6-(5-phosphoribosylamino)uracil reductase